MKKKKMKFRHTNATSGDFPFNVVNCLLFDRFAEDFLEMKSPNVLSAVDLLRALKSPNVPSAEDTE